MGGGPHAHARAMGKAVGMTPFSPHPVVCGVDESPEARAAAHLAAALAGRAGAPLVLAHVGPPSQSAAAAPPPVGGAAPQR